MRCSGSRLAGSRATCLVDGREARQQGLALVRLLDASAQERLVEEVQQFTHGRPSHGADSMDAADPWRAFLKLASIQLGGGWPAGPNRRPPRAAVL